MPDSEIATGQLVLAERRGTVGHLTLNRPDAMNAITIALARELEAGLRKLGGEPGVVVIRGAGGNFCAGGDFDELSALRERGPEALRELFVAFRRACDLIAELPAVVVSVVEGYAMAGGFELAQASDVVLVADEAKLGDNHANFGMVPGGGGSQRLPRLVGAQRALGLMLTGERLSGAQAAEWGLAYRSVPAAELDASADALVERLAGHDAHALAAIKGLVRAGLERPLAEGLDLELDAVVRHIGGDRAAAGIARFEERRG